MVILIPICPSSPSRLLLALSASSIVALLLSSIPATITFINCCYSSSIALPVSA